MSARAQDAPDAPVPREDFPVVIETSETFARTTAAEMCEHKGIGHPDTICDGVAEAVSQALCKAYVEAYGAVQHHNVDKALLVGGQSVTHFGGGRLEVPMRLIVCGRATALPATPLDAFVCAAASDYLTRTLRCPAAAFTIESAVRTGSPNLRRVVGRGHALANDTSFGTGYAPFSDLELTVLQLGETLRSDKFRSIFSSAGDDYKVMGSRIGGAMTYTVALALIDRHVHSVGEYFETRAAIEDFLGSSIGNRGAVQLNQLDDAGARDESGVYLTVTGLSAEHGDDGQVGRGNRVNGLITPCRTMSLEAAAGKNPVAHVGKIYNVLARRIAEALVAHIGGVSEASVQLLSTIGQPLDRPALVAVRIAARRTAELDAEVRRLVREHVSRVGDLTSRLARGELRVY